MNKQWLSFFKYKFDAGPISLSELSVPFFEGNCRRAIQDFFFVFGHKYFSENELLNPNGYLYTGSFLKKDYSGDFFDGLPTGAVIYAEGIRNKHGKEVDKSPHQFQNIDDYIIALHSAIFIEDLNEEIVEKLPREIAVVSTHKPSIWHATAIEGATCLWSVEKFLEYYKPVAAKLFA